MKGVKICGLTREEDIQYVNTYKPEYIGFVFAKSKRQVTMAKALQLKKKLDPTIQAVGVFVNEDISTVLKVITSGCIDMVQLHGQEDATYIQKLKEHSTIPLMKAINVTTKEDIKNISYDVDYYVLDGANSGCGETFDWRYIKEIDKPYFLAGGIGLENINEAMKIPSYGIDVSSGVETKGIKDQEKIKELIRRIRNESR